MIELAIHGGFVTLIDDVDADLANMYWRAHGHKPWLYVERKRTEGKTYHSMLMHRVILERMIDRPLVKGELVDHINGNTLDNRRSNLRLCTHAQNQHNRKMSKTNTSGHKGVTWNKSCQRWQASIRLGGNPLHLGLYDSAADAAKAYSLAAEEYHGEFSVEKMNE